MPFLPSRRRRAKSAATAASHASSAGKAITGSGSVIGSKLDVAPPTVRPWEERLAQMEAADPDRTRMGGLSLEHPDELVPYIDVEPSYVKAYDWSVGLYDEIRLFVDDDSLGNAEGQDPFESRFARVPGVSAAMREDREIIHVAAPELTAAQVHALAVDVVADAAQASARLRGGE